MKTKRLSSIDWSFKDSDKKTISGIIVADFEITSVEEVEEISRVIATQIGESISSHFLGKSIREVRLEEMKKRVEYAE